MLNFLLPDKVNDDVRAEQIRLVHSQGVTIQFLGVLTALISVTMFWDVANHISLLIWLAVMIIVSSLRLAATITFNTKVITNIATINKWGYGYVLGTFISGVIWGTLAFLYDPTWPAPYQVILFVIYTGITAGAFNTNTPLFIAFPAFYLPPVLCLVYVMLQQAGKGSHELAGLFMIYIVLMYVSAIKFHNHLSRSLQIRFDNEHLAEKLAEYNQQLTELADKDELTQLYNRRSMDKYLSNEWNRHLRSQQPLSLLFIDIDYFKQFNDTYGHEGGDKCLVEVANIIHNNARRSIDMAARFGGEEFAVILPETGEEEAIAIAESIRAELKSLNITHSSSSVADHVTLSIGLISLTPQVANHSKLLRELADKALYTAKQNGRDRIVVGKTG